MNPPGTLGKKCVSRRVRPLAKPSVSFFFCFFFWNRPPVDHVGPTTAPLLNARETPCAQGINPAPWV